MPSPLHSWRSAEVLFGEDTPRGIWNRADLEGGIRREAKDEQVPPGDLTRNDLILWFWAHRWPMQEIADEVGLSRQRVHQIIHRPERKSRGAQDPTTSEYGTRLGGRLLRR